MAEILGHNVLFLLWCVLLNRVAGVFLTHSSLQQKKVSILGLGATALQYLRKNKWDGLLEHEDAADYRFLLIGSTTIPTPAQARLMNKLVDTLKLRDEPGIDQPKLRTELSPASLTVWRREL